MSIVLKRFTAKWCSPCKEVAPIIDSIGEMFPSVLMETIDVEISPDESQKYDIRGLPTIVLEEIEDGSRKRSKYLVGKRDKTFYVNEIQTFIDEA